MTRARVLGALLLAVVVLGSGTALAVQRQLNPSGPPGEAITVVVPKGASTQEITVLLDDAGVVGSARAFRLYLRVKGEGGFQAGTYNLRKRQSFASVLSDLEDGPDIVYDRLVLPEGLRLTQIAERVGKLPERSADKFLGAAETTRSSLQPNGVATLEGLLFPDTYLIQRGEDEAKILRRLVGSFERVAAEIDLTSAAAKLGITPYEAVIVASLVEREASVAEDRGPIARVIYNRLERDMLLQVDATVLYALGSHKTRVLFRDLEIDSPYNTYRVKGLPPTPIAVPGRAALRAALSPPTSDDLFYVVVEASGKHAFASTNAEHQRNIRLAEQRGVR